MSEFIWASGRQGSDQPRKSSGAIAEKGLSTREPQLQARQFNNLLIVVKIRFHAVVGRFPSAAMEFSRYVMWIFILVGLRHTDVRFREKKERTGRK